MPITNSPLTSVTLTATSGNPPVPVGTQTIPLSSLSVGTNSVQITPGSSIYNALQSGATVTPSLQLEYSGLSVVSTAGTPYVPPPDYSVTDFARVGGFELTQNGNPELYPLPKYLTYIQFKSSSVGGVYAYKLAYYLTSNPANKIVLFQSQHVTGQTTQAPVFPLEPASIYTVAITLVNKDTLQELTNLQPVQTITLTTPTPAPPPPVILDTNGVTLKYTSSSIPSGQSNPYIVESPQGSGIYYAVMSSNNADSISKIQGYVNYVNSNPTGTTPPNFTAPNQTAIPFNRIVTTLMTNMSEMFMFLNFNQPINSWDTSNVTNMSAMFRSDTIFNQDISSWDTSNVTNMSAMFNGAIIFNQNINYNSSVSTTAWNTSTVTNMDYMFVNDTSFIQDISGWIVTLVQPKPPVGFSNNSGLTNAQLPLAFRV